MKFQIFSGIVIFSIALAPAFISGSCSNSGDKKTENTDQQVAAKDGAENAVSETRQPASAPATDSKSSEGTAPDKEKATEEAVNKQATSPSAAKETSTTNNAAKASGTSKPTSKPEINKATETTHPAKTENGIAKTTVEQPKSDQVSPTKAATEKEETKVVAQPQPVPKPAPAAEKPKDNTVPQAAKEDKAVAAQAPGNWIVPAKDKNKSNPVKADTESLSTGKSLYGKHCASCHGKTGRGDGSKAAQLDTKCGDFTLSAFQNQTDGSIFYKTKEGKGDMPGFKKKIPDEEEIWSIVNYIRTLK